MTCRVVLVLAMGRFSAKLGFVANNSSKKSMFSAVIRTIIGHMRQLYKVFDYPFSQKKIIHYVPIWRFFQTLAIA